jgi:hypothetical protein
MSAAVINDGILRITSMDGHIDKTKLMLSNVSSIEADAIVSLTWSACCYGAFLAQDKRAEIYVAYSHRALQRCFDGSSVLVARAFFALEFILELFSESSTLSHLATRKGVYFGLGEAILFLPSTPKDEEVEMIWNMIRYWKSIGPSDVNYTIHEYWSLCCSQNTMEENDNPIKHSHVLLHYWTCILTSDYFQEILPQQQLDEMPVRDTIIESHMHGILNDIRQIKALEDTCMTQDTNPPTTVILHFSLSMHRLRLHQFERAFHGLKSVAAFFWMHPFILSTPKMWKIAYITRMVLLNSELTSVVMQSSLRPVADDLFALLCHTGKLFGFNDVYSSNSSTVLSNIRKNIMKIMFTSSSYIESTVKAYTTERHVSIGENIITVLTMNGWLRLAQGEVIQPVASAPVHPLSLLTNPAVAAQQPQQQQQPVKRLSSLAVPSNFIDKRICAPEKPISNAVESQVMASTAAAAANRGASGLNQRLHPELSRDALIMLDRGSSSSGATDRSGSGRRSNQSSANGDIDTDEPVTKKRSSRRANSSKHSTSSSQGRKPMREAVSSSAAATSSGAPVSWPEVNASLFASTNQLRMPVTMQSGFNRNNSATSGVDELLLHMMNDDCGVDYSRENIAAILQANASTAALATLSYAAASPPATTKAPVMNRAVTTTTNTTSSSESNKDFFDGRLASVQGSGSGVGQEKYGSIPRVSSEMSMSVMDNIDTWMADLDSNQATYA